MKGDGPDRKGSGNARTVGLAELNGHGSTGSPRPLGPFIVQHGPGKPQDPALRRLIRSHVMQGRFLGQKKQKARNKKDVRQLQSERKLPSPRPVSGYSLVPFAENLDPATTGLLRDQIPILEVGQYPSEVCTELDYTFLSLWFPFLMYDASFLNSIIFALQTYAEWRAGSSAAGSSSKGLLFWNKALNALQERLASKDTASSDSTIAAVTCMATIASQGGDGHIAMPHLHGLKTLVDLRGGLDKLGGDGYIGLKACRVDLGTAMVTGGKPLFYSDISYSRWLAKTPAFTTDLGLKTLFSYFDPRLVNIWADLCAFCHRTNTGQKFTPMEFARLMVNVMYRLLHLDCSSEDLEEALRLGMLVFVSTVFLQFVGRKTRFDPVGDKLKRKLARITERRTTNPLAKVVVWLQCVSAISFVGDVEKRVDTLALRLGIEDAGVTDWEGLRDILMGMIWVDKLHDGVGRRVYDAVVTSQSVAV